MGGGSVKWTQRQVDWLTELYPDTKNATIAKLLGRTLQSIRNKAVKLGLKKSPEYMATKPGCFKPGGTTWNKGIPFNAGGRSAETRFKHGQMPHNWVPVGTEREDKDGVLVRKFQDTGVKNHDWRPVHVVIWEQHYGPLPDGHIVIFKDGNHRNFDLENLEGITRQENMRRNSVHRLPKEVALAAQALGALNRQINKRAQA